MVEHNVDVLILGGGVGGLSTAHVLHHLGYTGRIVILEKNSVIGGQARSSRVTDTHGSDSCRRRDLPTEKSWRVYFPGYQTLDRILRQIPSPIEPPFDCTRDDDPKDRKRSVYDHLIPLDPLSVRVSDHGPTSAAISTMRDTRDGYLSYLGALWNQCTWQTRLKVLDRFCVLWSSSAVRIEEHYSNISWKTFMNLSSENDKNAEDHLVRSAGAFFGADPNKVATSAMWSVYDAMNSPSPTAIANGGHVASVMDLPTSEAWFEPWHRHLVSHGVEIYTGTEVVFLNMAPSKKHGRGRGHVVHQVVSRQRNGNGSQVTITWKPRHVVCSLPPDVMACILRRSSMPLDSIRTTHVYTSLQILGRKMRLDQIGVQFFFDRVIPLKWPDATIYLVNSPWQVMIEPQGSIWRRTVSVQRDYGDGHIQDIWSAAVGDPNVPGLILGKTLVQCSRDEIAEEVWYQIHVSLYLRSVLEPDFRSHWRGVRPVSSSVWEGYHDEKKSSGGGGGDGGGGSGGEGGGGVFTCDPKTSPNAGTLRYRPSTASCDLHNLLFATDYTRQRRQMTTMDSAAEAGANAANTIMSRSQITRTWHHGETDSRDSLMVMWPLQLLDAVLFSIGLPHVSSTIRWGGLIWMLVYVMVCVFACKWIVTRFVF